MAEAMVENQERTQNSKFYCHQCSLQITPKLPDFTCPRCDNGFIEEITEEEGSAESSNSVPTQVLDPATQFAQLWGRAFLDSFSNHAAERDEGAAWNQNRDSDDEVGENMWLQRHRPFPQPRTTYRRNRPVRNQYLHGLFQYISDQLEPEGGGGGFRLPINVMPLHSNPNDYVWGAGGLDAIITQLLNQLEGSGAPPANQERIEALPTVKITQKQVDDILQCSVCMDDFHLNDEVKKLPCDHHYHNDCIVTWLKMHGTCPVCRKDLNGEDTSLKDTITPIVDSESPSSDSSGT
ncbi:E3 ubiquitin-protein ligase RNF115-like [Dreissena polymorpha]|uniref:RING-type E3 ubiquitin transferase n=1 Tax=Dreissena polymorpha TaxID=45954 RepID=A0A9D4H837_DREPO|nr:E3 ubiquitin-protein ligase RNF115-like [Dreissena polymorpha]KAH3830318.1 hypothetical protein DPMN_103559 [Dreissena polymorpha]